MAIIHTEQFMYMIVQGTYIEYKHKSIINLNVIVLLFAVICRYEDRNQQQELNKGMHKINYAHMNIENAVL